MFDAGSGNANRVTLLESVLANSIGRHLPGYYHQRNRIGISGSNAGYGVGHARARSDQRHAHFMGRTCITVRRVQCALLVTNEYVFNLVLLEQFVVNVEYGAARIAEHMFDTFFLQATYNNFSTRQLHG